MKTSAAAVLIIGAALGGGFFAGRFKIGEDTYALIEAPKAEGEHDAAVWHTSYDRIEGAQSYNDGLANTKAMAEAGSEIAKWARGLRIADCDDWYIPSRDELELIYRNLKPGSGENSASFRDGDNPSSVPVGYPYTDTEPALTSVEAFRAGGAEAMEETWYWTSTQYAPGSHPAWCQYFDGGDQDYDGKDSYGRVRAVRRIKL